MSLHVLGATSVTVISSSLCDVSDPAAPRQVAIVIRPFYIRVDLMSIGGNVLPIPRSASPTSFGNVPKPLVALNPFFTVQSDAQFGRSLAFQTTTDVLNPPSKLTQGAARATKLNLMLNGQRSLDNPYYDFGAAFNYVRPEVHRDQIGWSFLGVYRHQPDAPRRLALGTLACTARRAASRSAGRTARAGVRRRCPLGRFRKRPATTGLRPPVMNCLKRAGRFIRPVKGALALD